MKLIKQFALLVVVIALSAGTYAMMISEGASTDTVGSLSTLSLPASAILFGMALLIIGNMGNRAEK